MHTTTIAEDFIARENQNNQKSEIIFNLRNVCERTTAQYILQHCSVIRI